MIENLQLQQNYIFLFGRIPSGRAIRSNLLFLKKTKGFPLQPACRQAGPFRVVDVAKGIAVENLFIFLSLTKIKSLGT